MADTKNKNYLAEEPIPESYLKMSLHVVAGMIISWIRNRKCKDRVLAQEALIAILRDSLRGVVQAEQENR